jgi:hypothetical protein
VEERRFSAASEAREMEPSPVGVCVIAGACFKRRSKRKRGILLLLCAQAHAAVFLRILRIEP